jgi:hypothetical protein
MSTPPPAFTIPIALPVGPESRIGEIITAAMNRHAKADKTSHLMTEADNAVALAELRGKSLDPKDVGTGIIASARTGLPPEVRAGIAISFIYSLSELVKAGAISRAIFRDLNHNFQSLLIACDAEIMLGDSPGQEPLFNRMSHAFFLDLEDLERGKTE